MQALPQPNPQFWNRIAPSYAKKPVPDESAYRQTLDRVCAHLTGVERVLELGCGTGSTALTLSASAKTILATDLSPTMIDIARGKAEQQGTRNVEFRAMTSDGPELQPESFDVVMAFNLFHLLSDVPGQLTRVRELLRPGGLFVSKTPCIGEYAWPMRALLPLLRSVGRAPYVNCFKVDALERWAEGAGFTLLESGLHPQKTHSLFLVGRRR